MVLNITKFSDELLNGLEKLAGWPDKVKLMQLNWIGKSYGCEINFEIVKNNKETIKVFTTRPDTIFGASFIALSVDHLNKDFKNDNNFKNLEKNVIKLELQKKLWLMLRKLVLIQIFCKTSFFR